MIGRWNRLGGGQARLQLRKGRGVIDALAVSTLCNPYVLRFTIQATHGCLKTIRRSAEAVSVERLRVRRKQGDGTCILGSDLQAG